MRVALVDVDSKIPNLALMKASAYHKGRGDTVGLFDPLWSRPDLIYASKIFDFTPDYDYYPDGVEILRGGPAYDLKSKLPLPDDDRIMPDYGLFGCGYAMGRFSRGCPNRCPWCIVPKMDGNDLRHVADLKDWWCGQDVARVMDDNLMADEDLFVNACGQLSDAGCKVVWEALDIRRINDRTAAALASVRPKGSIHFAWDGPAEDGYAQDGIRLLERHGLKPWRLMFYVLVGFNSTPEYDMYRITTLRDMGANPFVMPYDKTDPYQKRLARWCNNKAVFKKVPNFDDYR